MIDTRKTAFNIWQDKWHQMIKMEKMKSMLTAFVLASAMLTAIGASEDSWDLGSSDDWMSTGPVYHSGPYYYPNSDLSTGTQRFLNTYPSYMPLSYSNYNQKLVRIGNYTSPNNYLQVYNNPYIYDPQASLDLAAANHAFQKSLNNYYSRYGYYGS
jgi:hypothetical protein